MVNLFPEPVDILPHVRLNIWACGRVDGHFSKIGA